MRHLLLLATCVLLASSAYSQMNRHLDEWGDSFAEPAEEYERLYRQALLKATSKARIVLLGEFTHGSHDVNEAKAWMTQTLAEQGYTLLLLESGMGELGFSTSVPGMPYEQQLAAGLIGPWRVAGGYPLLQAHASVVEFKHGVLDGIEGFDVQRTGRGYRDWVRHVIGDAYGADFGDDKRQACMGFATTVAGLEAHYDELQPAMGRRGAEASTLEQAEVLAMQYDETANWLARIMGYQEEHWALARPEATDEQKTAWHEQTQQLRVMHRTLLNRAVYLRYMAKFQVDNDWIARWNARDSMMAANIIFFAEEIFPDQKIVVSAHNYHISRANEIEESMGERLVAHFGKKAVFSLGVFALGGTHANNARQEEQVQFADAPNSLNKLVQSEDHYALFITRKEAKKAYPALLQGPVAVPGFVHLNGENELPLFTTFDALFILQSSTPAVYPTSND